MNSKKVYIAGCHILQKSIVQTPVTVLALQKHLGYFNHILGCLSCISVTKKCY